MKMQRLATLAVLGAMMLSGVLGGMTLVSDNAEAAGNPVPVCTVNFDQPILVADVAPGKDGLVTFTGKVECQATSYERVVVGLSADAGGWGASIVPPQVVFRAGGGTAPITMSVRAPPRTSYAITQKVTVSGSVTYAALRANMNPSSVMVQIRQFFEMDAFADAPYKEVSPNTQVYYNIKVNNRGNGVDRFMVEVANLKDLTSKGFSVNYQPSVTVEEQGIKNIQLSVAPQKKSSFRENQVYQVSISITSEYSKGSERTVNFPYSVYIYQNGWFAIPGFDGGLIVLAFAFVVVGLAARRRTARLR